MQERRIGLIGGGNMAAALARGLVASGRVTAADVRVSDPSETRRALLTKEYGIAASDSNAEVARWASVVVLAVKPQFIEPAVQSIAAAVTSEQTIVSLAAGVPLAVL